MNLPYFIAKRLSKGEKGKSSSSTVMVKIATISVALSIAVMLIAVGVVEGFKREMTHTISGFAGDIQLTYRSIKSPSMIEPFAVDDDLVQEILNIDGVHRVEGYATVGGMLQSKTGVEGVMMEGVDKDFDWSFLGELIIEGEIPNFQSEERSRETIIPIGIAQKMNLKVGDIYNLVVVSENSRRDRFKVSAIYESGMGEFDSHLIIADITTVRRISGWNEDAVEGYRIFGNGTEELADEIFETLPAAPWNLDTLDARFSGLFDWIEMLSVNASFVLIIMIIVAVVNMTCAVLVIILESIRMIGILKTQGATTGLLQRIFVMRSSYIVIWGMIFGNVLGIALAAAQHYLGIISLNAKAYLLSTVPMWLSWTDILLINAGSFVIITLLMIIPTLIVERLSPAESIKYN